MKASVIILSYNQKELIQACLFSLSQQCLDEGDQFEVVVIDNGSVDGTGDLISRHTYNFPLQYYYIPASEHSSRAIARNRGITAAVGKVVIFLDGDQLAGPDFVYEHLRVHKRAEGKLVIGFRRYLPEESIDIKELHPGWVQAALSSSEADERFRLMEYFSENGSVFRTAWHLSFNCNFSANKDLLIQSGMLDEEFKGWGLEDSELGYRLYKAGGKFIVNKKAMTFHIFHPSEFDENRYAGWKSNLDYFIKCHPIFEVQAQSILKDFFDPGVRKSWWDCYIRFEKVVRAHLSYDGDRLPVSIIVAYTGGSELIQKISEEAADREVLVIDKTSSSDLDIFCQFIHEDYDVLYYRQPSEEQLIELYHRYAARGIAKHDIFR
ncbi:glycosyltransferase [Paenibacillus silvae]|uniref:glycosyltransferase n=1 Tax=Paenibacillus silvae TaxID=1325358 RepID=UPI003CEFEA57